MKIFVAMNEFKGSLTSGELGGIISNKINEVFPESEVIVENIADGGDGFLNIFKNFSKEVFETKNANLKNIKATYLLSEDKREAVVEVAEVIGLKHLNNEEKNPYNASTRGLGELINMLLNEGVKSFIIGLGGSATNDCGIGLFSELGYEFVDENNNKLQDGINDLRKVVDVKTENINKKLRDAKFTLVSDVDNPLFGNNGATYIYSKQKGLREVDFENVDKDVESFSKIVTRKLGSSYENFAGAGAAGGLGYAFLSFSTASIVPGSKFMIDYLEINKKISSCDLVITGEGRLDAQSFMGKAPIEVAKVAKKYNKKVIFLAGHILDDEIEVLSKEQRRLVDAYFTIQRGVVSLDEAMNRDIASKNVARTVEQILKVLEFNLYEK